MHLKDYLKYEFDIIKVNWGLKSNNDQKLFYFLWFLNKIQLNSWHYRGELSDNHKS